MSTVMLLMAKPRSISPSRECSSCPTAHEQKRHPSPAHHAPSRRPRSTEVTQGHAPDSRRALAWFKGEADRPLTDGDARETAPILSPESLQCRAGPQLV